MAAGHKMPVIPESLLPFWDDQAQTAHERMACASLDDLLKKMPKIKMTEVNGRRLLYAELPAIGDSDNDESQVLSLPHANGWKPSMYLRARIFQESTAPDKRLIILPNNTLRDHAYELTDDELDEVENGDLTPIAELQARLIKHLGIGRVSLYGYSLGGMDAAVLAQVLADDAKLVTIGIFEAPNVMERSVRELKNAFVQTGLRSLAKAVKDAQIPALQQVLQGPNLWLDVIKFGLATEPWSPVASPENRVIVAAMTYDNLSDGLLPVLRAQPDAVVFLAAAERSLISPPHVVEGHYNSLAAGHGNISRHYVEGYGHEMGDNIVVHGLLGKAALSFAESSLPGLLS